ncbi:MAG: 3-methyl-2-oxobutanoate dehydrogenase subunit VorB [Candidatus Omnitrophota bacterium]
MKKQKLEKKLNTKKELFQERILISGNEAIASSAIASGCRFYAGYPITPQNELTSFMAKHMPEAGGVFIQAESEVAAINMVFGASCAGARAMTSSSSPGISLKQEGISYLVGAELPCVIVNIMRGGPGLGNIAPSQSDYFQATRGGGHGDYHCIVLAPSNVQEAVNLIKRGFDLADKYRNPVLILGDGMLGQMMEPIEAQSAKRKTQSYKKPWALTGCKNRKPNQIKSFYMAEGALEEFNKKLQKKFKKIEENEVRFEGLFLDDAEIVIVSYGTMSRIAKQAILKLRDAGFKIGLIRPISLWPFPSQVIENLSEKVKKILVVEMSYGQMIEDVKLAVGGEIPVDFYGRAGGGIPSEEEIIEKVKSLKV